MIISDFESYLSTFYYYNYSNKVVWTNGVITVVQSVITIIIIIIIIKLLPLIGSASCWVSMLTLLALAIYRFSAVMFPMRARLQNKKKRLFVLLLSRVIPMVVKGLYLVYNEFHEQLDFCYTELNSKQSRIWIIADLSLFRFLPLLIMLVLDLYLLIIIK